MCRDTGTAARMLEEINSIVTHMLRDTRDPGVIRGETHLAM